MNHRSLTLIPAVVLLLAAGPVPAADTTAGAPDSYGRHVIPPGHRMIAEGKRDGDLIATGGRDAVTAPVRLFNEIGEETRQFGPVGLVTGPVRGSIKASGQAMKGGARMLIGLLDILTSPFGRID
jgi:hypothetical protein